jgi:hypothetical protein
MVGTGRMDQQSIQAAIWTRTDNLTFSSSQTSRFVGFRAFAITSAPSRFLEAVS